MDPHTFREGTEKVVRGMRRARDGYREADEGFIQILEGIREMGEGHEQRMAEMQETIRRLERLLLDRR